VNHHRLGVLIGVVGFWAIFAFFVRIDTNPVMQCVAKPHQSCVFQVKLEDGTADRICFREIGKTDFLTCTDREADLDILPVRVQPPPPSSGAIVFEAITINTHLDPPLSSRPASVLGFIPDLAMPEWQNNLILTTKRFRWRWSREAPMTRSLDASA
jgi:hypothetical protein